MKYVERGHPVSKVLRFAGLSPGSYYRRKSSGRPRGRPLSDSNQRSDGSRIFNQELLVLIRSLLEKEFVDYGYLKVCYWLRDQHDLCINPKKVYRLMSENGLLNRKRKPRPRPTLRARGCSPSPSGPGEHFELDIIHFWMPTARRYALVVNCVDLFHRAWTNWKANHKISYLDVLEIVEELIARGCNNLTIRTDNGGQFVALALSEALVTLGVVHEFIHPGTPQQNAHVESFHSILRKVIPQELEDLSDLSNLLERFEQFYNHERIHSATAYYPPMKFLEQWKRGKITWKWTPKGSRIFLRAREGKPSPVSEACVLESNNVNENLITSVSTG